MGGTCIPMLPPPLPLPHAPPPPPARATRLMGPTWDNRGRLTDEMMGVLLNLPGTRGMLEMRDRADALTAWKLALQKGCVCWLCMQPGRALDA
jgi:hypothetical protein